MNLLVKIIGIVVVISCCAIMRTNGEKLRVCYFTNWAQYRPQQGRFTTGDVDASLCSHVIWAFATLSNNRLSYREWNDKDNILKAKTEWRRRNPSIKILLAIGGWNAGSTPFTNTVATKESREEFSKNAIEFLRNEDLDGLDIDWEYPANRGSPAGDRERFTALARVLRRRFDDEARSSGKEKLVLAAATAAGKGVVDTAYELDEICRLFDFIDIMAYDLQGSWNNYVGLSSPLYALDRHAGTQKKELTASWVVDYYIQKGCPASKLVLGIAFYGRSFRLCNANGHQIDSAACGAGTAGRFTREAGYLSYTETRLKQKCSRSDWKMVFVGEAKNSFIYSKAAKQWSNAPTVESVQAKAQYVVDKGLAGAMVWALDTDDFNGITGDGIKFPLLRTVNAVLKKERTIPILSNGKPVVDACQGEVITTNTDGPSSTTLRTTTEEGGRQTDTTRRSTTPRPPSTTASGGSGKDDSCDKSNGCSLSGHFCVPSNPHQFYQCHGGRRFGTITCPAGLVFDARINVCNWPSAVPEPRCPCP